MKDEIIKLRKEGKTYNQISDKLNCAKSTVAYHLKHAGLGTFSSITKEEIKEMQLYYDKVKTLTKVAEKFGYSRSTLSRYIKTIQRKTDLTLRKKKVVKAVSKKRRELKKDAVEYLGGKCKICGYNNYIGALEFHHIDPSQKDFSISTSGNTRAWVKIKKELDKCILLCANCHREVHGNKTFLNQQVTGSNPVGAS